MPQKSPVQPKKHLGQHFLTDFDSIDKGITIVKI